MSDTSSFVDPVFLDRFGLSRMNVIDYFLHPLNPFRSKSNTCNEILNMQGITIQSFLYNPNTSQNNMSFMMAELEYNKALCRLLGEQYELLPPYPPITVDGTSSLQSQSQQQQPLTIEQLYVQHSPLYTIRHVLRTNITTIKVLGIYYVVEGIIYKAPCIRSIMKTIITRTSYNALYNTCTILSNCIRYHPCTGYIWVFEEEENNENENDNTIKNIYDNDTTIGMNVDEDPIQLLQLYKKNKVHKVTNTNANTTNATGSTNIMNLERTAMEEEYIRASEAIDQILVRLSKQQ